MLKSPLWMNSALNKKAYFVIPGWVIEDLEKVANEIHTLARENPDKSEDLNKYAADIIVLSQELNRMS